MDHATDKTLNDSPLKMCSNKLASKEKVIIRIKKQEFDIDVEGNGSESDESVSYTCEFVHKDSETKSEFYESYDESEIIESVRQDENFIYPVVTNSDDDMDDVTWQPSINSAERKNIKCLYPKKRTNKSNDTAIKHLKKDRSSKTNNVLEDIDVSELDMRTSGLITKKVCDTYITKVYKSKKGMATAKQRLGRIIKIHKMLK